MSFRQLSKEDLSAQIPPEIAASIRLLAAENRRSISETTTELLCLALGIDPRSFAIDPVILKGRRRKVASTSA